MSFVYVVYVVYVVDVVDAAARNGNYATHLQMGSPLTEGYYYCVTLQFSGRGISCQSDS
jgi:hypothetical protein